MFALSASKVFSKTLLTLINLICILTTLLSYAALAQVVLIIFQT